MSLLSLSLQKWVPEASMGYNDDYEGVTEIISKFSGGNLGNSHITNQKLSAADFFTVSAI